MSEISLFNESLKKKLRIEFISTYTTPIRLVILEFNLIPLDMLAKMNSSNKL